MKLTKFLTILTCSSVSCWQVAVANGIENGRGSWQQARNGQDDGAEQPLYRRGENQGLGRREVGNITTAEVDQVSRRRTSLNLWGYGLGPYKMQHMATEALVYAVAATSHREVSENAELRFRFGFGSAEDGAAQTASLTIGAVYMPLRGDASPLMGAEFGVGFARGKQVSNTGGFAGALLLGMRLFRTSSTQMELAARYESLAKVNQNGRPATYGVQVAVLL